VAGNDQTNGVLAADSHFSVLVLILGLRLFVPFRSRNSIGAAEPAVKIDIGAALGTEGTGLKDGGFAANRARLCKNPLGPFVE
jgi:hypothetical protein